MYEMKECPLHGQQKFYLENKNSTKPRFRCSQCMTSHVAKRRRKVKLQAIQYKGGKCCRCGYNKCVWALEFHHRDSKNKNFAISKDGITWSWNKVKEEIDKCDLICANCHREEHYKEYEIDDVIKIEIINCKLCNKQFEKSILNTKKIFCSRKCSQKAQKLKKRL